MLLLRVLVTVSLLIFIQDVRGVKESNGDQDHGSVGSGNKQSILFKYLEIDCGWSTNFSDCALDHQLGNLISNALINITADVMLLSIVSLVGLENVSIIGHNNPTVNCNNAGGLYFDNCHNCRIIGITWEKCGNKTNSMPAIELFNLSNIIIQNCSFQDSITQAIVLSEMSGNVSINNCKFVFNNHFEGNGTAIYYISKIRHHSKFQFIIINCNFTQNGASDDTILVYISPSSDQSVELVHFINIIFLSNRGRPIYVSYQKVVVSGFVMFEKNEVSSGGGMFITNHSSIMFKNSEVKFINNMATDYGGALYISQNSTVTFKENSTVTINNNQADYGGALSIGDNSNVTFEGNSTVTISNNQADYGGALSIWDNSDVTFEGNSIVTINDNHADFDGGALYIRENSDVTFEGNSTVTFNDNHADYDGGALYIMQNSNVTFEGNSTVTISDNQADYGGALYIRENSDVTFEGNSTVTFNDNHADYDGGALYIMQNSNVTFEGNSTVTISDNQADYGGALYIRGNSDVTFEGNSAVTINNNHANHDGGALYIIQNSNVTFEGNSRVTISNNQADYGGALYIRENSDVTFEGNSTVTINNNHADYDGGALYIMQNSNVTFEGNSRVTISNNQADYGGALYIRDNSDVTFEGNSTVTINNNQADYGGAFYVFSDSIILFHARSTVKFNENIAFRAGGALYSYKIVFVYCTIAFNRNKAFQGGAIFTPFIVFGKNSAVLFNNNKATLGGALHISNITFKENTAIRFENNTAVINGGAIYSDNSNITAKQNSTIIFTNNNAEDGGAVYASVSTLLVSEYSNVTFDKNIAGQNGGAIYFNNLINASFDNSSVVTMTSNTADNYGGAIYSKITKNIKYFNVSEISGSSGNTAGVTGNLLYIDVPKSFNSSCLSHRIVGVNNYTLNQGTLDKNVATSPKILKFYDSVKCIGNESTQCEKYYINNIMLGQEISIYPCLLDHYNKPAEVKQFRIIGEKNINYSVHGLEYASISCNNAIKGISIVGAKTKALNYSIYFTSYAAARENISANLTVELSPCHLGFKYQNKSQKCECYNKSRIVSCSGSSSIIARSYWFGHVTSTPTVTICPINYCNFDCCRTTNGYYQLSPERVDQCKSHRSGTACGSCEEGRTLSYGSANCISIKKCSTGLITLVVILTVLYWLIIVVAVFIITCYRVGIGYFYVLTYYYSVVDIMLSQHTDLSDGLYITVTIMSSIAKISPQFLGQLCLFKNMSGIDQQFIHYIHPLAVSLILIIISWLARHSKRLSMFISRGIIHAICFLLLLSYTSVATTSLLLMRPLTFADVDNLYTYLSPDIQYFHGRHLPYGITAIILSLLIIIGLPLLLLTEPFLNRKINYFRIKPLLDQFQGCYKDKYRWFAAYYMICRLIIIIIIIANFSDVFISRYLLLTASTIIALVHEMMRPYNDNTLNIFDGAVLLLVVLVTALPLLETFDSSLVKGTSFVLVILPLIQFIVMKIYANNQTFIKVMKIAIKYFQDKDVPDNNAANNAANDDIDLVIDDSMRQNATIAAICDR